MKIVADPNIPFVNEAFRELGEIQLIAGRQITAAAVRDAEALFVRSVTPVNASLLAGSRVRFVATATIGTDHVDEGYLRAHGIGFASAAGSNANSVAEYVVAALLELAHRQQFRLRDKTLGVVGVGNVGRRVVRYAEALGMRVLPNDPPRARAENLPGSVPLDRLLAAADILTLHVPLTRAGTAPQTSPVGDADATWHLFDKARLSALERRPVLLNSARGAVVDNKALLAAIDGDKVRATVLDVWENEPDISLELLDVVDLATPHIAGYSFDGKVNGTRMIQHAAATFFGQTAAWDPTALMPAPTVPRFELRAGDGEDDEDVLRRAVARVYSIVQDDAALRKRPREFDRLRAVYPSRREFDNTAVLLRGGTKSLRAKLGALGFQVG